MENYILCCDWGTSSFRLQLVNSIGEKVIGQVHSADGISKTFNIWKEQDQIRPISQERFFQEQLGKQIEILSQKLSLDLENIPIIISGMASSTIGMKELPYATLPFPVDGSNATIMHFDSLMDFPHHLILISGVRSESNVMRGEETQLIGLATLSELPSKVQDKSILIFPGTHSKHILVADGQLIDFFTFMTGEVFDLMVNHSILKQSVEAKGMNEYTQSELDAFKSGVKKSQSATVWSNLFTVRTNQLFNKLGKRQNFLFLSGLLIGAELQHLREKTGYELILCSGTKLFEFYKMAFDELDLLQRTMLVSDEMVDKAAIAGQIKIFHQANKTKGMG